MRALTLHPLWAWAAAAGHRRQEWRSRRIGFVPGERIAIHASLAPWWDDDLDAVAAAVGVRPPDEVDTGVIVALATVGATVADPEGGWLTDLQDVASVVPADCRGQLGLWTVPDAVEAAIAAQLAPAAA